MDVKRSGIVLKPDRSRVLFRPFLPTNEQRVARIVARVMSISEEEVAQTLTQVLVEFRGRHARLEAFLLKRFEDAKGWLLTDKPLTLERKLLIGSYFTHEYSLESAALFNPSMVWHPDQEGVPEGARRFAMSLRATGEGHISSITFRSGIVAAGGEISLEPVSRFVSVAEGVPLALYEKHLFQRKLYELGIVNDFATRVLSLLEDSFTLEEFKNALGIVQRQDRARQVESTMVGSAMMALAEANYEIAYAPEQQLSERVIFPNSPTERNGIEDARFVQFVENDGRICYYATYTAYDGAVTLPQLLETRDFLRFKVSTLNGPEVQNKGMALFPRRVQGHYAMLSRQDNENIYVMYSDNLHFWYTKQILLKPTMTWEFVQVGNCGSPLETSAGWLVLSHGVGPMRKYSLGAFLLDIEDPTRVIARLVDPLLTPNEEEREGYVPNVVYSCGAVIHHGKLVIPYAMSDYASSFAVVELEGLLAAMQPC